MQTRCNLSLLRLGSMVGLILVLAGCTKGGEFDPTTLLDNNMFADKTPLKGQREPVFPNGVPGVSAGIPADLYKGYQPPPPPSQQAADTGAGPTSIVPPQEAAVEPRLRPRPKRKVVRERPRRTKVTVGLAKRRKPAKEPQKSQTVWPAPPSTGQLQQAASPSQSIWPNPPATGAPTQ